MDIVVVHFDKHRRPAPLDRAAQTSEALELHAILEVPQNNLGGGKFDQSSDEGLPLRTGDDLLADRDIDFIKMDVQGWEMRILEGGAKTITCYRPVMVIELVDEQLSQVGDSLKAAWGLLESWGYRAAICIDGTDLTPLEAPQDGDIFWLPD